MKLILKLLLHKLRGLGLLENSRKRCNSLTGFTLIELIMTIVVVGEVALPISVTLSQHIASVFESQDLSMAVNLARFDLAQMNNTAYASIISATLNSYQGYKYDLVRTVTFVNGTALTAESTVKIDVKVYRAGTANLLASLTTYISKNLRYPY